MSLKARLTRCSAPPVAPRGELLFPLSCVSEFLEGHSIVKAMDLSARDVHGAILEVDRRVKSGRRQDLATQADATRPAPPRAPAGCLECKGYVEMDVREGNRVCVDCGLVQERSSMGMALDFAEPFVETKKSTSKSRNMLAGVSAHVKEKVSGNRHRLHSPHWEKMEHYNAYVQLQTDDLIAMDRLLAAWTEGGPPSLVRVAAVLLYLPLKKTFPEEGEVRKNVRIGANVDKVVSVVPDREFECSRCGRGAYSMKEARYCCRVGGRKRETA
tara:strand:- start:231 stop:1043 length:813 start_codon:yes stop_codon:yes gene_type:complete